MEELVIKSWMVYPLTLFMVTKLCFYICMNMNRNKKIKIKKNDVLKIANRKIKILYVSASKFNKPV